MTKKKKQLYTEFIEDILLNYCDNDPVEASVATKIYMAIHLVNCRCLNPHEDWEREIDAEIKDKKL